MERLTARDEQGFAHYPYCFEKCNGDSVGIKCQTCDFEEKICNKLTEYEDLEEQGLLSKLPCKVGDTVYYVFDGKVKPAIVTHYSLYEYLYITYKGVYSGVEVTLCQTQIGKTVFLTEQEAQSALEKMKGD